MEPKDPIIDEIHVIREAIAAECGYDMNKIAEWMRAQQNSGNREAVTLPPKHVVDAASRATGGRGKLPLVTTRLAPIGDLRQTLSNQLGGRSVHSEPMIAVRDVSASAAWYRELLGCTNDHDRQDFDRLVDNGRVLLMLHRTQAEEHGLAKPVSGAVGSGFLLWIYVADLDVTFRRAKRLKAAIVVEPHTNPQAGWREFTLRDPDGYHIAIAERDD